MAKIGRPRKYETAAQLKNAVERYFKSITYERDVIIKKRAIGKDEKGKTVIVETPAVLLDGSGKAVKETVYLEEPSKSALCLFLGISRDTWAAYTHDEAMGDVAESVDARMLARLEDALVTRNSVQGVIFNLKANYGMTDRIEITQKDGGVEAYLARLEEENCV